MHVVMGMVGDCSGKRDSGDSSRLQFHRDAMVLLRRDIDWAVGSAA